MVYVLTTFHLYRIRPSARTNSVIADWVQRLLLPTRCCAIPGYRYDDIICLITRNLSIWYLLVIVCKLSLGFACCFCWSIALATTLQNLCLGSEDTKTKNLTCIATMIRCRAAAHLAFGIYHLDCPVAVCFIVTLSERVILQEKTVASRGTPRKHKS